MMGWNIYDLTNFANGRQFNVERFRVKIPFYYSQKGPNNGDGPSEGRSRQRRRCFIVGSLFDARIRVQPARGKVHLPRRGKCQSRCFSTRGNLK